MLSTIGVGLVLRQVLPLRNLVITGEFVGFTIYGLAFSLIAAASLVIRRRDVIILILASTVIWGIFVVRAKALGMVHFIAFATLITAGVLLGGRVSAPSGTGVRIGLGALVPCGLCGAGGLVYYGLVSHLSPALEGAAGGFGLGLAWGLSLGLAVGLGVTIGHEVVQWMRRRAR